VPLKNRQQSIPGGFDWNQPETGFTFRSDVFITTRDAIIGDRMRNPRHKLRTDPDYVEWEMEQRYVAKLKSMPGGDQWLVPEGGGDASPPVFRTPRSRSGPAAGLSSMETAKAGIGLLKDAFGPTLKTVPSATSEARSKICAECPENKLGNVLVHAAGSALKMLLEARDSMKLKTSNDDQLHDCAVCSCNLKVKVHVVLPYILEKTTPEVMQRFPENCWIKHPNLVPE
jgi:hypothetical protein